MTAWDTAPRSVALVSVKRPSCSASRVSQPRGALLVLVAAMLVVLCGMVAFAVDVGVLALVKTEAQNAADAAALAGANKLLEQLRKAPIRQGVPLQTAADLALARLAARNFATQNRVGSVNGELQGADIDIGYMADPSDHSQFNQPSELDTSTGLASDQWPRRPYNAVRVRIRRDQNHTGGSLPFFFARVLGTNQVDLIVTATSMFPMGTATPQRGFLPFAYQVDQWNAFLQATGPGTVTDRNGVTVTVADNFTVDANRNDSAGITFGADGTLETKLFPDRVANGNYGTINFSTTKVGNSTNVLRDIITNAPSVANWPDLPQIQLASPQNPVTVNGDPGISAGMEPAVQAVIGQSRVIALYSTVRGEGNNTYFTIVGFAPVTLVSVDLGNGTKQITIQPRFRVDRSIEITPNANPDALYARPALLAR
ncbi:MAG: hypothetical protein HY000_11730 [Planctomycetes bacterium]|nr:hypothetical protein [Planctomycetota bacterium]